MNQVVRVAPFVALGSETLPVLKLLPLSSISLMSVWPLTSKKVDEFGLHLVRRGLEMQILRKSYELKGLWTLKGLRWGNVHDAVKSMCWILVLFIFCEERICSFLLILKGIHDPEKIRTTGLE